MVEIIYPPLELKDRFPKVKPERIRTLMESPFFKARLTLVAVKQELRTMKTTGIKEEQEMRRINGLLDTTISPVLSALYRRLTLEKFNFEEITAADMVADKVLTLPEQY